MKRFEQRVVVVTGGSSGIGLATAARLIEEGARVVLAARDREALHRAAAQLGDAASWVVADVTDATAVAALAQSVKEHHGAVDALILAAGIAEWRLALEADPTHVQRQLDVNFHGVLHTVQAFVPLLREGSSIVIVTSVANTLGAGRTSAYAATKAAARSLARTLSTELLPRGIRVNAVSPGPTETAIQAKANAGLTQEEIQEMVTAIFSRMPLRRMARPEEVASAIAYLASPEASYVVGQELVVDGGLTAL